MKRGFTCGAFDLLHAGHVHMLEFAKSHCDYLIVGLHSNPNYDRTFKNIPVQTLLERWMQLKAVKFVDEIIPYDTENDLVNMLATQDITHRFLGEEYRGTDVTGTAVCKLRGIQMIYTPRVHTFSSTDLRKRVLAAETK